MVRHYGIVGLCLGLVHLERPGSANRVGRQPSRLHNAIEFDADAGAKPGDILSGDDQFVPGKSTVQRHVLG
jgi:hypothetical protein